jgi:hypothetical protein
MDQLPLWVHWAQLVVEALGTLVIAGVVAYIGYRQWRTAYEQVVLDLFERRMTIYDETQSVLGEIMREGTADHGTIVRYDQATSRLKLMFGDDVATYADKTRARLVQFSYHEGRVKGSSCRPSSRRSPSAREQVGRATPTTREFLLRVFGFGEALRAHDAETLVTHSAPQGQ